MIYEVVNYLLFETFKQKLDEKLSRYSDIRDGWDQVTSNVPTNTELFRPGHFKSTCEAGGAQVVNKSLINP